MKWQQIKGGNKKMYRLNDEKMFHDVADGVAIVINFSTGVYFGFNQFGTAVLDCLLNGADVKEISKDAGRFEGCPDDIEDIISGFVQKLVNKEILVETTSSSGGSNLPPESGENGFVPEMEEFTEVQDLILADPIHEVDPGKGWPEVKK